MKLSMQIFWNALLKATSDFKLKFNFWENIKNLVLILFQLNFKKIIKTQFPPNKEPPLSESSS